jgi:hypothetical protein
MRRRVIPLAVLLMSVAYFVAQAPKGNGSPNSPQQKPRPEKAEPPSAGSPQTSTQPANKPSSNPPAKEKAERDWFDYVTLGLTAILAATAVFGTCYALQTLKAIQHEAKIATAALKESSRLARASKVSADALTEAANASKRSAEFAERATRESERAYVLLEALSIIPFGPVTGDSKLSVSYKNFGRTIGRNVRFKVEVHVAGENLTKGTLELPPVIVGAGQDKTITFQSFRGFLAEPVFNEIVGGKRILRVLSSAVYEDVFGSTYTTHDTGTFESQSLMFRIDQQVAG